MPGLDHDVHEKTRIGADWRYGCWNKPRPVEGQTVRSLYSAAQWPYVFSTDCRFDMSLKDPACEGCFHQGMGEQYDIVIREQGT